MNLPSERVRLHITPFDAGLLPLVIAPADLPTASNVSYHTLQAFSEKRYGYVELPRMTAEKVRKKIHGSILKGSKMRVEEARVETDSPGVGAADDDTRPDGSLERRSKRQKREKDVVPGVELPMGRKVERGWTGDPKSAAKKGSEEKKRRVKTSSNGKGPELLFKLKLPPNVGTAEQAPTAKDDETSPTTKDKKCANKREVVVHEFSKTTKYASFLRDSKVSKDSRVVSQYIEDKGWVDEHGETVETIQRTRRTTEMLPVEPPSPRALARQRVLERIRGSSGSNVVSERPNADEEQQNTSSVDETSSSGTASSSSEDDDDDDDEEALPKTGAMSSSSVVKPESKETVVVSETKPSGVHAAPKAMRPRGLSSTGVSSGLIITIPANQMPEVERSVHPLESLFKRPAGKPVAPTSAPNESSNTFSFFEADPDPGPPMPQTPFTIRDYHDRGQRSAAPTPDTAAPGRRFSFPWRRGGSAEGNEGDEDKDDDDDADMDERALESSQPESSQTTPSLLAPPDRAENGTSTEKGFEETFWEKRGETNRAWKMRRRVTGKERKQMENKRLVGHST